VRGSTHRPRPCGWNEQPARRCNPANERREAGPDILHLLPECCLRAGSDKTAGGHFRRNGPSTWTFTGGDERTRTADPLLAKQVLYQLSYVPVSTCGNVEPRPCTAPPKADDFSAPDGRSRCEPRTRAFPRGKCRRRPDDGGVVPSSPSSSRQHPRADDPGPTSRRVGSSPASSSTNERRASGPPVRARRAEPTDRQGQLLPYLLERCTGRARTGLRVFDGRGRQYLPGRGGDGEAVETSQVGVGDQPGLPVALLELDRW
jgi:hypothetical protein